MTQKIRPRHPEKVRNPINPIKKKPNWIRSKLSNSKEFFLTKTIVNKNNLVTVCQEANCPNITECWSKRHATFMIMGDTCTRACAFCDVKTGKPTKLDELEPIKISQAVKKLNLKHVVITSVDREGTSRGFDLSLTKAVTERVEIPVIASGGMGCDKDLIDVVKVGGVDAVAMAHVLHYEKCHLRNLREKCRAERIPVRVTDC